MMTVGSSQPGYGATTEKFDLFRGSANTLTHTHMRAYFGGGGKKLRDGDTAALQQPSRGAKCEEWLPFGAVDDGWWLGHLRQHKVKLLSN